MENRFYDMYLEELAEVPACSDEETQMLLKKLPDESAIKRLAEGSLSYIADMAAQFINSKEDKDKIQKIEISDLVQEGNMAVLLLLKHYASAGGTGLEHYYRLREVAVQTAMQQLVDEQESSDKTAEKLTASINVLNVVTTRLASELGRQATLAEIAAKMKMSEDEVRILMKTAINAVDVDRAKAAGNGPQIMEDE